MAPINCPTFETATSIFMQKQKLFSEKLFPLGLMFLIDVLLTGMSFILSYVLCSMIVPDIINHRMLIQLPVVVALTSLIFLSIGIYKGVVKYDRIREVYSIFNAICLANILTIILVVINGKLIMEEDFMVPLSIIIVHSILSFSALVASRFLYKRLIIALKKKLRPTAKVLFVHDFESQTEALDTYMEAFKEKEYSNVFQNNINEKNQKKKLSETNLKELGIQQVYFNIRPHETEKLWATVPNFLHLNKSLHLVFQNDKAKTSTTNNEDFVFTPLRKEYLFPNMLDASSVKKDFISNYKNKTVLITGAGGLIGRELVKQLVAFGTQTQIILVDNSEAALRGTMAIIDDDSKQNVVPKLTDVKERDSLKKIFKEYTPKVVIHAAGNNFDEFFEDNFNKAVKHNVMATKIIADLALDFNVERFVFCSHAEAILPSTNLHVGKRLSELYINSLNGISKKKHTEFRALRMDRVFADETSVQQWSFIKGKDQRPTDVKELIVTKTDTAHLLLALGAKNMVDSKDVYFTPKIGVSVAKNVLSSLKNHWSRIGSQSMIEANTGSTDNVSDYEDFVKCKSLTLSQALKTEEETLNLCKEELKQKIESICLNQLFNEEDFTPVFELIHSFGEGHWENLHTLYVQKAPFRKIIKLQTSNSN